MTLNWNFPRVGGLLKKIPSVGGGISIFWNYTISLNNNIKVMIRNSGQKIEFKFHLSESLIQKSHRAFSHIPLHLRNF